MHTETMLYWDKYSDIANKMFHTFLNGYVNILCMANLSIEFHGAGVLGLTVYPNNVKLYLGSIIDQSYALYLGDNSVDMHEIICTAILSVLAHELIHIDRPCSAYEYKDSYDHIELEADSVSYSWIQANKKPIEDYFQFRFNENVIPCKKPGMASYLDRRDIYMGDYYKNLILSSITRNNEEFAAIIDKVFALKGVHNICVSIIVNGAFKRKAYIMRNNCFIQDTRAFISVMHETTARFDMYMLRSDILFNGDEAEFVFELDDTLVTPIETREYRAVIND